MTDTLETSAPLPKVDPASLTLRGSPRRVTRFRRGVIIAAVAISATGIAGVSWLALRPPAIVAPGTNQSPELSGTQTPDALAKAPKTYGDVPKLGPPLPGDLGKPILDSQRPIGVAEPEMARGDDRAAQAIEAARQRAAADLQAARQSPVMVASTATPSPQAQPATAAPLEAPKAAPSAAAGDPNGQQGKRDFVAARDTEGDLNPHMLVGPATPNMLSAGTIISASLITGLDSDLPGNVVAQVTAPVYDSATGRTALIPQGSRILGSYDSVIAFGQRRALVVWQRLILPDGSSIRIDNWPASDLRGYAGLADKIDRHTWQLLKGVALATLLGVGTEISFSRESDLVEAIRESTQQNSARAGDQLVRKNLDVQPTIRVRPGWPLTVIVHKDLVLPPWKGK